MGRWGYQMLDGDTDREIVGYFEDDLEVSIESDDQTQSDAEGKLQCREKLDAGLTQELYKKYKEAKLGMEYFVDEDYILCLLTAFLMHFGAKIPSEEREYLKKATPKFEGAVGYRLPIAETEFRAHGKAQFTASLEHYVDGEPRDLSEPCCANCGKLSQDLGGTTLKRCIKCSQDRLVVKGMYCNKECQKANWKDHKVICGPRRGMFVNV